MGFSRTELETYRDAAVADLVGDGLKLLFVGINPGLWTAATQTHFAHPGNRFYPALLRAGVIEHPVDPAAGMSEDDRSRFVARGLGITNLVNRATVRASELTALELRGGAERLEQSVRGWDPKVVAIAGVTAYRTAFSEPKAEMGLQDRTLGDARLWVVPNPSGLNAHETIDSLAEWYRAPALAAGVIP